MGCGTLSPGRVTSVSEELAVSRLDLDCENKDSRFCLSVLLLFVGNPTRLHTFTGN